jgi:twitching motility protein PilU
MQLRHQPAGIGRFRVNAFVQQGRVGIVLRTINVQIPEFEDLKLPPVLKDVSMTKRGLVLFVGGTGSGKSTSLAAMIGYRNQNSYGHIITIEDPSNTCTSTSQLRNHAARGRRRHRFLGDRAEEHPAPGAGRDPDRRDPRPRDDGARHRLRRNRPPGMGTLHANNANQAIDRIINFFPEERRPQLLMDLSLNLKAIVSQRLIPSRKARAARPRSRSCSIRR